MGSLPNLARLEETNLRMNREEAARLASDRRQQVCVSFTTILSVSSAVQRLFLHVHSIMDVCSRRY